MLPLQLAPNFWQRSKRGLVRLLMVTALAGTVATHPAAAAETGGSWPQFLGPNRDGISAEKGLLETWPAGGPKVIWRVPGGVGMSGMAVADGRVITLVQRGGSQVLLALDAQRGTLLWEAALAPEYANAMGNGPRGTPTIQGDRVYAYTGEGILAAVSCRDGRIAWSQELLKDLNIKPAEYGMACSPLVVDGRVLVTAGSAGTLVAYECETGKWAWTAGQDPIGYSSPALRRIGNRQQVVVFTGNSAIGLAPKDGTLLWRYPYVTDFNCNIATPLVYHNQVFLSAGENHGSTLLALKAQGQQFEPEVVWESLGAKSVLRNEWQTSILLGDHLYGFDNVGGAGPISHLTCVRADTGQPVWQKARFGKGNLIAAEGKLFVITIDGELVVIRAQPQGYEEIGRVPLLGMTRQAPALANGLLYARDDTEIVCVDVRKR